MGPPIALLFTGLPSDLAVSVCGVQLALRTESRIYALRQNDRNLDCDMAGKPFSNGYQGESRLYDCFRFVTELAEAENVPVSCHLLSADHVGQFEAFLINYSITCLVMHAESEENRKERLAWLANLQARLNASPQRFYANLQIILAPPLNEMELAKTIKQLDGKDNSRRKEMT